MGLKAWGTPQSEEEAAVFSAARLQSSDPLEFMNKRIQTENSRDTNIKTQMWAGVVLLMDTSRSSSWPRFRVQD